MNENVMPAEGVETEENAIQLAPQAQIPMAATMWNDTKLMNMSWRTADMLSKSSIIPQSYRGKPGDCLLAIDMGNRMGITPIMVMQNSQVVRGNFTWKGSACKAFIDGCGRFKGSTYVEFGERGERGWGVYLQAISKATGETIKGPSVTWGMAIDEGWVNKDGSKWKTMPDLMLRYRAAAFFARTECPEVLMGFHTADEIEDVKGVEPPAETVKFQLSSK
jgi:hypothetical protein